MRRDINKIREVRVLKGLRLVKETTDVVDIDFGQLEISQS